MGVLTNCISAGQANCAIAAFMSGVEAAKSGIEGATSGGMLKEAKIVMLSRRQKSEYEILGTWMVAAADGCGWQVDGDAVPGVPGVPGVPVPVVVPGAAPVVVPDAGPAGALCFPNNLANLASL